mmetsp:Transcript_18256/g.28887  ORF Transcript_18256/g.28887 Transcript_18256/m.28887 type:complete len:220 (+) Transcript_18256:3264-3923(+)
MVGMFAHNNRVIDHDPQRNDQPKKRDHVDRQSAYIHQRDGRHHCHGNACGHPKGRAHVQEQKEQADHQPKTHKPIVDQDIQTARNRLGPGADQLHRHGGWQGCLQRGGNVFDHALNGNGIPLVRAIHADRNSGVVAHEIAAIAVAAQTGDGGHIAHAQLGPIRVRAQNNAANFLGAAFFGAGADAGIGPGDIPRRACVDLRRDGGRNLRHCYIVGDQLN